MKKDRTLIDINEVKKFNKFEDIQELLYETFIMYPIRWTQQEKGIA